MEPEKPGPPSVIISSTPAVGVTPGSPVLDLPDTHDDSDAKSALKKLRLKNIVMFKVSRSDSRSLGFPRLY